MYQAILFDLDGTLLGLDNSLFIETYFKALAPKIAPLFGNHDFTGPILTATEAMMRSQGKHATLREQFIETFNRTSPLAFASIEPTFIEFYSHDFNQISAIARRLDSALPILQAAARHTPNIVLATAPVFPRVAVDARCVWAGIESFPFIYKTSFENMRYCKPNPDYYREIADHINVSPEHCLMIGNDHIDDMAAAAAGMETFLVLDDPLNEGKGIHAPTYAGYLNDLLEFFII
jgi:FMN phosphatase YigB (HAD superfamily)